MDALTAMGLLSKDSHGRYRLESSLAPLLTRDGDDSILPLVLHRVTMWKSWSNLTDIVKRGQDPHRVEMESRPKEEVEAFIGAMHVIGLRMADTIARSLDLTPYRRLLDLGGGSGTYTMAFLEQAPHLRATLFDLPSVIAMARERLKESGQIDRVDLVPGDFATDELPPGHDLVLLSAIIHMNSRDENLALYGRIARAIVAGGVLLIRDYFMNDSRTFPPDGAIFAVNMLTATRGGNSFTFAEVKENLEQAGFTDVRMIREGTRMDQVVKATKG
jgi:predicted O-methyltransferase YrrM